MASSDWKTFNYVERAKTRPTSYLTEELQPAQFFAAFVEPLQQLEEVYQLLYDSLSIYAATGIMLDAFGEMVNEPRLARDDTVYRAAILAKRFTAGGSGTPEELMAAISGLTNAPAGGVRILNHFPAAYIAIIHGDNILPTLPTQIHRNTVAGVAAYPVFDYAIGGFELSGIGGAAVNVLGIRPGADVAAGSKPGTDVAVGVNASIAALGGTRLASSLELNGIDYGSAGRGAYYFGSYEAYRQQ
jgi:hypothetical protein